MQELDDIALLREYVERDSEEAFAALVTRHIDRVYSVALRHTRNPHQAEEVTQAVFVILAQKSRSLRKGVILEGWLFQTARLTAVTFIRSEVRRARREQEAHMRIVSNEDEPEVWSQITPLLDAGLAALNEPDRNVVVMRFFYGKSMREISAVLGGSEDTARMRVNRAVEKLQKFFLKRGVALSVGALTAAISANSVQAAPAVLSKSIAAVAMTKGVAASGSTLTLIKGALKVMAWTKMKTAVVVAVVLAGAAGTTAIVIHEQKPSAANAPGSVHWNKSDMAFAGYQTPQATLKSVIWAMSNGDTDAFIACGTPEWKAAFESQWKGRSKDDLKKEGQQLYGRMTGLKIVDEQRISEDRALVVAFVEGEEREVRYVFVKTGGEWKITK